MSRKIQERSEDKHGEVEGGRTSKTRRAGNRAPAEPPDETEKTLDATRRRMSQIRNVLGG